MTFLRNGTVQYGTILEGMSHYFKAMIIGVIKGFITALGLIFFVAPGIVIFYMYSQTMFILADDPSKGPLQCLRESRIIISGNKMALWRLDMTYIFLIVMGILPANIAQYTGLVDPATYSGMIVYLIFRIVAYMCFSNWLMGRVTFYELLTSRGFKNFKYSGEAVFREGSDINRRQN